MLDKLSKDRSGSLADLGDEPSFEAGSAETCADDRRDREAGSSRIGGYTRLVDSDGGPKIPGPNCGAGDAAGGKSMRAVGLLAAALMPAAPLAGAAVFQPGFAAEVATNAQLAALSLAAGSTVYRNGFYAPGDGGAASYTYSASACPLNSGTGDNGSQVASAGGGCWIADFNAIPANVRQWGAYGDCTHDDSAAIKASLASAVRVRLPPGDYLIGTPISLALSASADYELDGDGWTEAGLAQTPTPTSGCTSAPGSYLSITNSSVGAFTFTGFGNSAPRFRHLAVLEKQPAVGAGWAPTIYPPIWTLDGSNNHPVSGAQFEDIGLSAVYDAVYAKGNTARIQMDTIYGQVWNHALNVEDALDVSKANNWHLWGFWSLADQVYAWQDANSIPFLFHRQDSFQADNIFIFGAKACVQLSQWTTHNPATGNFAGPPTAIHFGNLNCDSAKYPIWIASISNGAVMSVDHMWVGGETCCSASAPIPGSNAIQIDGAAATIVVNDINLIGINNSVVNQTNATFGSQVHFGRIQGGSNGWNWTSAGGYYSGTSPVINDASPAAHPSEYSISHPVQPQNAGATAGHAAAGVGSGIINTNSNALLFMSEEDQASYSTAKQTSGATFTWPNWSSTVVLNAGSGISTLTVNLPNALDGTALRLICNNTIKKITFAPLTGSGAVVSPGAPRGCSAKGKELRLKFIGFGVSPPTWFITGG